MGTLKFLPSLLLSCKVGKVECSLVSHLFPTAATKKLHYFPCCGGLFFNRLVTCYMVKKIFLESDAMFRTISLATTCLILWVLPNLAFPQNLEVAKRLPSDTCGYFSISDPAEFIRNVDSSGLFGNEKFQLAMGMIKSCFPGRTDQQVEARDLIDLFTSIDQIVVVVHRAEQEELLWSLGIEFVDAPTDKIETSVDGWIKEVVALALPTKTEIVNHRVIRKGKWMVISNSTSNADTWLKNIDEDKPPEMASLYGSRRFKSAVSRLDLRNRDTDVFVYANPALWKPFAVNQEFVRESDWEAKAFDEIASIALVADVHSWEGDSKLKCFAAVSFSFTVPRSGIGAITDSYLPIEEFPPLVDSPSHVTAIRKDNQRLMKQNREIYDAMYGEGTFDRLRKSFLFEWKFGEKKGFSGTEFNCWYGNQDYFPNYLGFLALDQNLESQDQLEKNTQRYFELETRQVRADLRIQRMDVAGLPAWFFDEAQAKNLFLAQRPYLKEDDLPENFSYPNSGAVLWNRWLVLCEKEFAKSLEQRTEIRSKPEGSFGEMLNALYRELPNTEPAFYIESRWQSSWRPQIKSWQIRLLHLLYPDAGDSMRRFAYEADPKLLTIETDDPKEAFINFIGLFGGAVVDEMGQSTMTMSKTKEGNVTLLFGLFEADGR